MSQDLEADLSSAGPLHPLCREHDATMRRQVILLAALLVTGMAGASGDPWLWLEDIDGERALAWVREQNSHALERLGRRPEFASLLAEARNALDAESRVPDIVAAYGDLVYELRQDPAHPRGVLRRANLRQLRAAETRWETVLDVDAMSTADRENWVFKGLEVLPRQERRALVFLSRGGGDAVEMREFDLIDKRFVPDGFRLPPAKLRADWRDADTVYVGTDFGRGSLTESGYPRSARLWRRGESLESAAVLFETAPRHMSVSAVRMESTAGDLDLVVEQVGFFSARRYLVSGSKLDLLDVPQSAVLAGAFAARLVMLLKEDWQLGDLTFPSGSVIVVDPKGTGREAVSLVAAPEDRLVIESAHPTDHGILVRLLDNVRGRLRVYLPARNGWTFREVPLPDNGSVLVDAVVRESGRAYVRYESFTTPPALYTIAPPEWRPEVLKSQAAAFDGSRFQATQHFAASADGTRVPYFMVAPVDLEPDGSHPVHLFSYGGFRNSLTPSYSGVYEQLHGAYGRLWLERGGVFVLANIRGGGEFGEAWHAAALRRNRLKANEDFEAVAEDLVHRGVTAKGRIGIEGRSQGGLLVATAMIRRPDLYGAVVCGVPLADMKRFHKLLAGASWVSEYGDPDDAEAWAYLSKWSPYQNLRKDAGYPPVFIYGSTRDDRVHPGHGRKLAARLQELGYEAHYWENTEGGHGGSSTSEQLALRLALAYSLLWSALR